MLRGGETCPVTKENKLTTLQRAEMRMISWMYGVKVTGRFLSSHLRQKLVIGYIITVIQRHRLRWCGHVLRKDENYWVKNCMDFEVEDVRSRGDQRQLGVKLWKKIFRADKHDKHARKMLQTVEHREN